jgi:hypothetical protein
MEAVVAQFIIYPHTDKCCTTDTQGEAENVDERKAFLAE